jgi:predicted DNA-binding antitoxin AbrB/MazE fold protein
MAKESDVRWVMGVIVTAIYEKGVLRPLKPLSLKDGEIVTIEILPRDEERLLIHDLVASQVLTAPPGQGVSYSLSSEERIALADRVAKAAGRLVSEMIIQERQEQ